MGAGLGDVSVFGGTFEDESFSIKHAGAGDVGMASTGPHSNACQFYISLDKLEWLDNQKMVFGKVVDGLKAVKAIGKASVAAWNQKPTLVHYIAACGKLTPQMVLDKRTALHTGVGTGAGAGIFAAPSPAPRAQAAPAPGGGGGPAEVLTLGDGDEPAGNQPASDANAAPKEQAEEVVGVVEAEEAAGDAAPDAQLEIFDQNAYDDDAHAAALKMQQAGRGMLARKNAKKLLDLKFSETMSDISAERLWEVSLARARAVSLSLSLLLARWNDAIPLPPPCSTLFLYLNQSSVNSSLIERTCAPSCKMLHDAARRCTRPIAPTPISVSGRNRRKIWGFVEHSLRRETQCPTSCNPPPLHPTY